MRNALIALCILVFGANLSYGGTNFRNNDKVTPIGIKASGEGRDMQLHWTKPEDQYKWSDNWFENYHGNTLNDYETRKIASVFDPAKQGYSFDFPCKITRIKQQFEKVARPKAKGKLKIYTADLKTLLAETDSLYLMMDIDPELRHTFTTPVVVNEPFAVVFEMGRDYDVYPIQSEQNEFGSHTYTWDSDAEDWVLDTQHEAAISVYLENENPQPAPNAPHPTGYRVYVNGDTTPFAELNDGNASSWVVPQLPVGVNKVRLSSIYGKEESSLSNEITYVADDYCSLKPAKVKSYIKSISIDNFTHYNNDRATPVIYTDPTDTYFLHLNRGQTYQVSVETDDTNPLDTVAMYIDWNNDHTFDDYTGVKNLVYYDDKGASSFTLTVPKDADLNGVRMRFAVGPVYEMFPCGKMSKGQVINMDGNVVERPKADFKANLDRVGTGEALKLTDQSLNVAKEWSWFFGDDANPETLHFTKDNYQSEVSVKYATEGRKEIILKVDDQDVKKYEFDVVRGQDNLAAPSELSTLEKIDNVELSWVRPQEKVEMKAVEDFQGSFPPKGWSIAQSNSLKGDSLYSPNVEGWKQIDADYSSAFVMPGKKYSAYNEYETNYFQWLITPSFSATPESIVSSKIAFRNLQPFIYSNFYVMVKAKDEKNWTVMKHLGENDLENVYTIPIDIKLDAYAGKEVEVAYVYRSAGYGVAVGEVALNTAKPNNYTPNLSSFKAYQLFRDGKLIASVNDIQDNSYTDEHLPGGNYTYEVNVLYNNGESYPTNTAEAHVLSLIKSLPYTQNFESDITNDEWQLDKGWKIGVASDLEKGKLTFDNKSGKFAAINTVNKYGIRTTFLTSPMLELGKYKAVDLKFEYLFKRVRTDVDFGIYYRKSTAEVWTLLQELDPSEKWEDISINLPADLLTDGLQLAFRYTTVLPDLGAGVDNIQLLNREGKYFVVRDEDDKLLTSATTIDIGRVANGGSMESTYYIYNSGTEDLQVIDIDLSNKKEFSISQQASKIVRPRESSSFTVKFTPQAEGDFTSDVTVITDAKDPNFNFTLSASQGDAEWTMMLYLYENGTGLDGNQNFNQLEVLGSIPGVVNYLVLYDSDDAAKTGIYLVKKDPKGLTDQLVSTKVTSFMGKNLDMDNWETLRDFGCWGVENYKAKHYGMILWDHGSGIFKASPLPVKAAVGSMTLWDMKKALAEISERAEQKIDFLGFDVCLLGQLETAYQVHEYVNYTVFSEITEPGAGWNYAEGFRKLNANPEAVDFEDVCRDIVTSFIDQFNPGGTEYETDATLAAVNVQRLKNNFIPSLNKFADALIKELPKHKFDIEWARKKAFYAYENKDHKDLGLFTKNILNAHLSDELDMAAQELLNAYPGTVIAEGHSNIISEDVTGMKIWIPQHINADLNKHYYLDASQYLNITETRWPEFLLAFDGDTSSSNDDVEDEVIDYRDLFLYPNPCRGELTLYTSNHDQERMGVLIYDLEGRLMMSESKMVEGDRVKLNTTPLRKGIYLMKLLLNGQEKYRKLVVE